MKKDMTYEQIYTTSREEMEKIMKEVIEKCKNDKIFEQVLLNDPTETLKKEGLKLQPGIRFQIIKTEEEVSLLPNHVIPLFWGDKQDSLSMEVLDKIAGGRYNNGDITTDPDESNPCIWMGGRNGKFVPLEEDPRLNGGVIILKK